MDTGGYDIWDYNSQVVSMQRRKGAALHRGVMKARQFRQFLFEHLSEKVDYLS